MSDDADLSLVSTEALIAELFNRNDAVIIAREAKVTRDGSDCTFDYTGGTSAALGLCLKFQDVLMERVREGRFDEDEEE